MQSKNLSHSGWSNPRISMSGIRLVLSIGAKLVTSLMLHHLPLEIFMESNNMELIKTHINLPTDSTLSMENGYLSIKTCKSRISSLISLETSTFLILRTNYMHKTPRQLSSWRTFKTTRSLLKVGFMQSQQTSRSQTHNNSSTLGSQVKASSTSYYHPLCSQGLPWTMRFPSTLILMVSQ